MACYEDILITELGIKCNLCLNLLIDDDNFIDNHVHTKDHKTLQAKKALMQQSVVIKNNNFYCYSCNKDVLNENLKTHVIDLNHLKNITAVKKSVKSDGSFLKIQENLLDQELSAYCTLCNCFVQFTTISEHILSSKHRRIRAIAIQPFNGIFSIEEDNEYLWCKFCQTYIHNYIEVIFDHVDYNIEHITNVTKILNLIKDQKIDIEKYLMDPKEDKAWCNKCDTSVSCNVANIDTHIRGKRHKK